MTNIVSAESILGGGGEPYLTAPDKAILHNSQTPFYITGATPEREGTFGMQTIFAIKAKGMEPSLIGFGSSASRVAQAKNVLNAIATGAEAIGPCYLGRWEANGRSGWQITFQPTTPLAIPLMQSEVTTAATTQRVANAKAIPDDDDLPF